MRYWFPYLFFGFGICIEKVKVYAFPFYTMNPYQLQPRYYEILQNYNAYLNQRRLACITFDFSIQSNTSVVYTFTGISNNTQDLRVIEGILLFPYSKEDINQDINQDIDENVDHKIDLKIDRKIDKDIPEIPYIPPIPNIPDIPDIPNIPDIPPIPPSTYRYKKKNFNDISKCWTMSAIDTVPPSSKDQSWCILELDQERVDWMIVTDTISQMTFALVSDIYNFTLRDIVWNQVNQLFPTTNFRNITGNCPATDPYDSNKIRKNEHIT
jgi:hypothetical protein